MFLKNMTMAGGFLILAIHLPTGSGASRPLLAGTVR